MAITIEYSTEYTNGEITKPPVMNHTTEQHGRIRFARATFVQGAAAGDIGSIQTLLRLPSGRVRILGHMSRLITSAFGASRTLSLGYGAYTNVDGVAVAASTNALANALDVSAAAANTLVTATGAGDNLFLSQGGVVIAASVAGGTIPVAATVTLLLAYVAD